MFQTSAGMLAPEDEDLYGTPEEEYNTADDGLRGIDAMEIDDFSIEPLDRTKRT